MSKGTPVTLCKISTAGVLRRELKSFGDFNVNDCFVSNISEEYALKVIAKLHIKYRDMRYFDEDCPDVTISVKNIKGNSEIERVRDGEFRWVLYVWKDGDHIEWVLWDALSLIELDLHVGRKPIAMDSGESFIVVPISTLNTNNCVLASSLNI